nr:CHASE3 domain-containing protein [Pirellula sp.]
MHISRGPVVFSAAVALALIGLNLILSAQMARELFGRADWVTHTHEVLTKSEHLLSTVLDAESELRGFLLTNRDEYLQSITQLESNSTEVLDSLSQMVEDNPEQVARLQEIKQLTAAKVNQLLETLRTARENGMEQAKGMVTTGEGRQRMERLDQAVSDFENAEKVLLDSRQADLNEAYRTTLVSAIGSGVAVLLAIGLHFGLSKQQSKKLIQQAESIHASSELMRFTFQSIGDGVITTDAQGLVVDMNAIAEGLTGWTRNNAQGIKLTDVFRIVNETTREVVDNPAIQALKTGAIVG